MKKLLVVLTAGLLVAAGDRDKNKAKGDREKLQGTWQVVSAERMGQAMPNAKEHELVIAGDTLTVMHKGRMIFKGKIKLDPSKKPRTLDMEITEGGQKNLQGKVSQGIYVVEGDSFKWCNAEPGVNNRPRKFATDAKTNHMLLVLKRAKK